MRIHSRKIYLYLIFQKIHKLPKSRYPALKDRTINIPIYESDVVRTLESLPRTPSEAGIIPVKLKRKLEYKNAHNIQYVSVKKVLKAVKTLKEKGHPDYQFVSERNFKEECEKNDVEGFNLLNFNEAQKSDDKNLEEDYLDDMELDTDKEEDDKSHMTDYSDDESDREEEECRTKDPVQKWQFEYNKSTCYSNNYPEISYKDEINDAHNVAPGEGKTPINVLKEKDWDIKAFPTLHPDGKNGLHEEREENLTEQNYFIQRILNKDHRFANSPAYVFASTAYVEKKQMERNIGISGIRGKPKEGSDGSSTFTLDDPCNVLDSIKNTPRYWQKAKSELVARLENLGPFTFFFTLFFLSVMI